MERENFKNTQSNCSKKKKKRRALSNGILLWETSSYLSVWGDISYSEIGITEEVEFKE